MADVRPFQALHYDLGKVGSLDAVAAPPYDVIDAASRARLLERSPYNAVAIDLPKPFDGQPSPAASPAATPTRRRRGRSTPGAPRAPWSTTPSRRSGR